MEAIKAISMQIQPTQIVAIRKQLGDLSINWYWRDWMWTPRGVQVFLTHFHPSHSSSLICPFPSCLLLPVAVLLLHLFSSFFPPFYLIHYKICFPTGRVLTLQSPLEVTKSWPAGSLTLDLEMISAVAGASQTQ